ncbi:hypothetical protein BG452_05125 [Streptomyces sp. CBMA123]|nr:hypothetical protein [Streptomyces sp. CBMA123]
MVIHPLTMMLSTLGWTIGGGLVGLVLALLGTGPLLPSVLMCGLVTLVLGGAMNVDRFIRWRLGGLVQ